MLDHNCIEKDKSKLNLKIEDSANDSSAVPMASERQTYNQVLMWELFHIIFRQFGCIIYSCKWNEKCIFFVYFQILFPLYEFHMEFDFLYISYDQFYFFITQAITWHTAKADFESNNMSSHPWTCLTNAILLIIPLAFSPAALCIQLIRQAICWNWFADLLAWKSWSDLQFRWLRCLSD